MSTHVCSHCIPTYIEEVRKLFKEAYAEAHLQTNSEADWQKRYYDRVTSTVQLMPGDIVTWHVKDQGEAEYVVVCQVTADVPTYEVLENGRNVKVIHCN